MKKWFVLATGLILVATMVVHGMRSHAALPENQWFSTMTSITFCPAKTCYDPGDGTPVTVSWIGNGCKFGFSTCTPVSCYLSCRDLLSMGMF